MEQNNISIDVQERIKADAANKYPQGGLYFSTSDYNRSILLQKGYIAGATAEAESAQKQIKKLLNTLETIVHAPVPANEREYISWFVTAKNIAGGAISEYEADNEMQQWKDRKEGEPKPNISKCGMCGKEGINQYLGNQFYLCEECFESYEKTRDQPN